MPKFPKSSGIKSDMQGRRSPHQHHRIVSGKEKQHGTEEKSSKVASLGEHSLLLKAQCLRCGIGKDAEIRSFVFKHQSGRR